MCRFKCGTSEYPLVENSPDGSIAPRGKRCFTCDGDKCTGCIAKGRTSCVECEPRHYLEIVDSKARVGKCLSKWSSADFPLKFDLFVSNQIDEQFA